MHVQLHLQQINSVIDSIAEAALPIGGSSMNQLFILSSE